MERAKFNFGLLHPATVRGHIISNHHPARGGQTRPTNSFTGGASRGSPRWFRCVAEAGRQSTHNARSTVTISARKRMVGRRCPHRAEPRGSCNPRLITSGHNPARWGQTRPTNSVAGGASRESPRWFRCISEAGRPSTHNARSTVTITAGKRMVGRRCPHRAEPHGSCNPCLFISNHNPARWGQTRPTTHVGLDRVPGVFSLSTMSHPVRQRLPHAVPQWVPDGSFFFITINCEPRGKNQLCRAGIGDILLSAVAHNHDRFIWHCRIALLMPDHLHAIIAFPQKPGMKKTIEDWKKFLARQHGVSWQRDFFDHRLRDHHEEVAKTSYILMNPVRRGLCERAEEWIWIYRPNDREPPR